MRSPAALSPNRVKRPRNTGNNAAWRMQNCMAVLMKHCSNPSLLCIGLHLGGSADAMDESCSQPSQSQPSQYDTGITTKCYMDTYYTANFCFAATGNGVNGQANGMFPVPQARKMLRKRYHSPPALRNVFLHGPDDAGPALPKAPLPASRYRCDAMNREGPYTASGTVS